MSTSPSLTSKELICLLEKHGFILIHSKGSHLFCKNYASGKMVIVPVHNKALPKGTLHSILKQAGIDI